MDNGNADISYGIGLVLVFLVKEKSGVGWDMNQEEVDFKALR